MGIEDMMRSGGKRQTFLIACFAVPTALLLFLSWFLFIRMPYEPAFTSLQATDAATIVEELDRLKVPHRLADQGATILVPKDQIDQARLTILGGDLPLKGAVGFELFNKSDMGLTEFAQKINYQRALQGELSRTIMALDEVDTARVHLSLPETGIFDRDRQTAKASITIATKAGGVIDDAVVRGIQQLVASAVPGLLSGNVAVLDARGRLLSQPTSAAVNSWVEGQQRSGQEQLLSARVLEAIRSAGISMPLKVDVISFNTVSAGHPALENANEDVTAEPVDMPRRTPLKVTLFVSVELGSALRDRLIAAAQEAVTFDAGLGDVIAIEIDPSLAVTSLGTPSKMVVSPPTPALGPETSAPGTPLWAAVIGALALLVGAILIRRRRDTMSPERREAFAVKLKKLLEEEEAHGADVAR